jgi:hypothetical protein
MNFFRLLPVVLSVFLLGAHFLRQGLMPVVLLILLLPLLLFFKRAWIARLVQLILVLGALEWIRTMLILVDGRRSVGAPWTRLAIILLTVAVFTGCSALLFRCRSLKARYKLDRSQAEKGDL